MSRDQLVESVARKMAAAYWRGKLESVCDGERLEHLIQEAMAAEWERWVAAARVACGDALLEYPDPAVAAENFVQSMTDQQFDDFVNAVEASPSRPKVALRPVTAR
jgi:hypothetical protein